MKKWKKVSSKDKHRIEADVELADGTEKTGISTAQIPLPMQWLIKQCDDKQQYDTEVNILWLTQMPNLPTEATMKKDVKVCPIFDIHPYIFSCFSVG